MKTSIRRLLTLCFLCTCLSALAQQPRLNSYPQAAATLFLDFDGHLVNGTSWNTMGPISCGPSNLTDVQMTEIFNRVAEDYRPFNINVTTDSTVYWAAPARKRMRVILTITSEWYGAAGGVSYIGSFNWGDNTPAFVFTALLGYNTKRIAEAAAHEAGHTLGLRHQSSYDGNCAKTAEYNAGLGTGEIGWAPIMGVGYYRNFTLWNNGANPYGCTSYQDDLGIITSGANGFTYRADDHANNLADATPASFNGNAFTVNGVIERTSDQDVFSFTLPLAGKLHIDANPYNTGAGNSGSNLDMQVDLLDTNAVVLGSYNPAEQLGLTIDTLLGAGNYYLRVNGRGNVYAPEYASLGSYSLNTTFQPVNPLPLHKLELKGAASGNSHQLQWVIEADETVESLVLETATDNRNFTPLAIQLPAARAYSRAVTGSGWQQYRLNVKFDNGRSYYSNVVSLPARPVARPQLMGNPVRETLVINSPSTFDYVITDGSGRAVAKGQLTQGANTISTQHFSSGLYLVRFSNGESQFQDKIIRQ